MKKLIIILTTLLLLTGCSIGKLNPLQEKLDELENSETISEEQQEETEVNQDQYNVSNSVPELLKPLMNVELAYTTRYEGSPQCMDYDDSYRIKLLKMDDSFDLYKEFSDELAGTYSKDGWYACATIYVDKDRSKIDFGDVCSKYNSKSTDYTWRTVWLLTDYDEKNATATFKEWMIFDYVDGSIPPINEHDPFITIHLNPEGNWYKVDTTEGGFEKITSGICMKKEIGKLSVNADALKVRPTPSTELDKVGKLVKGALNVPVFDIVEKDDYTWYNIGYNRWIADQNGEWVTFNQY